MLDVPTQHDEKNLQCCCVSAVPWTGQVMVPVESALDCNQSGDIVEMITADQPVSGMTKSRAVIDEEECKVIEIPSIGGDDSHHLHSLLPDFSGKWLCVQIHGDMEVFLSDMGLSDESIAAARNTNFGIGEQLQHIVQHGNDFEVENSFGSSIKMKFKVGSGEQVTVDRANRPIIVDPIWDGAVLAIKTTRINGELISHSERYLDGEGMALRFISSKGTTIERIFSRRK